MPLVVLRTRAGNANALAVALDNANWPEITGTVAGDDTLLCVADETPDGRTLSDRLKELAGLV